ncbi:ribosomal protection-like ABC-F family protein [Allobaculum sp. JKK-2023]|uniref:ribosomal protection-like ABC-F family protein n=1 Tax=Allobaculum sp. JKK-2023 TaxID=3108943 RepID=UPI002B054E5C|nr:ABC-F family ATP-binding cassette domain-containing protein [Allobaculum sp. JKK-2023]
MKLQVSNLYKSFGAHDILQGASLQVKGTEKIGLVGRNGCGKTTLLNIISGQEDVEKGERIIPNATRIGTLSQTVFNDKTITVKEALEKVFEPLKALEKELEKQAMILGEDHSEKQLEKYDRLQNEFETLGGYDYEHEMKSVFFHFGFEEKDLDKRLDEFSSGQQTRIALVRLLLEKPDVLLLDEPTNHLDLDSIEWLESYISRYPSAVILVSHDRMFLDHVCDEIVEIEHGKTTRYPGSYTHYVKAKEEWIEKNHEAYLRQQDEIHHMEELIEKFRYKKNKAAFAQSKIKYLERMDRIEDVKADNSVIKATFTSGRKGGNRVLEVDNLVFGYDKPLSKVSFNLFRQNRVGIIGPNGIGKSTLLKTLTGKLPSLGGQYDFGHQIDIGYFDQETAAMHSTKTVIDTLWDDQPDSTQTQIRNVLAAFLFTKDEVFKEVNDLSGGEKVSLSLARLMMAHDNLLILDEPTNHLDIPAKEALEKALQNYDGTLLFVSHDRMFLSKMADKVLVVGPESKMYDLSYNEYTEKKKAGTLNQIEAAPAGRGRQMKKPEPEKTAAMLRQEKNQLTNRCAKLEELLAKAEEDLETLRDLRYEPEYYQDYRKMDELEAKIDDKHNEIANLTKEWEEKMTRLEEMA